MSKNAIIVPPLMFLFANSDMWANSGLTLRIFLIIMIPVFLLICIIGNVCLDARHCSFIFLGAGYFYIPVSVLEFCCGNS